MELRRDSCGLSGLLGRRVVDASGRSFGRVYEVRGRWQRDDSIAIEALLVGRRALLPRLRGRGPRARAIPWEAVAEIGEERIVVAP